MWVQSAIPIELAVHIKQVKEDKLNLGVVWHTTHVCIDTFEKQQASLQRIDKPYRRMASVVVLVSVYLDTQILDCKERSQWRMVFHKESHVSSKNVSAKDSKGWAPLIRLTTGITIQRVTQLILSHSNLHTDRLSPSVAYSKVLVGCSHWITSLSVLLSHLISR